MNYTNKTFIGDLEIKKEMKYKNLLCTLVSEDFLNNKKYKFKYPISVTIINNNIYFSKEILKMKKTIAVTVVITVLLSITLLAIPKHEVPTDEEWEAYLAYEKTLNEQIDNGEFNFEYAVINRDTGKVFMIDTLNDCKDAVKYYETTKDWDGEMIIMPTGKEITQ